MKCVKGKAPGEPPGFVAEAEVWRYTGFVGDAEIREAPSAGAALMEIDMSNSNLIQKAPASSTPPAGSGPAGPVVVGRAKDIIAGRIQPPALVATPEIETFLQREFGNVQQRPTEEAIRRITERLCLEAHFGGQPVACFTTPAGTLAVLASGERDVEALLRGLSDEEQAKVVVTDTARL